MVLGVDTGFFVELAKRHPRTVEVWEELVQNQHTLVLSVVTINELLVYFFKRGQQAAGGEWVALMQEHERIRLAPVTLEIASLSARYRHGLGLPTVDSIILATCVQHHCEKLISTDSDFQVVDRQSVLAVEFLE